MSKDPAKKVLLFISHVPDQLKIVFSFLGKRNFEIETQISIKDALTSVFENKPDFVFIAWDHPDRKITLLPDLLEKHTASIVVPFINSNSKDAVIKFGSCKLSPKLYPPISGPAIERLILKAAKIDEAFLQKVTTFKTSKADKEAILMFQTKLEEIAKNTFPEPPELNVNFENQEASSETEKPKVRRPLEIQNSHLEGLSNDEALDITEELIARNKTLDKPKYPLSEELKVDMRSTLDQEIVEPLESIVQSIESSQEFSQSESRTDSQADVEDNASKKVITSNYDDESSEAGDVDFKRYEENYSTSAKSNSTEKEQEKKPLLFKEEEFGIPKRSAVDSRPISAGSSKSKLYQRAYCFSIVLDNWCGYFVIATKIEMDYSTLEVVFADWLKKHFPYVTDLRNKDFFEFNQVNPRTLNEVQKTAEFTYNLIAHNVEFQISFFSVQPSDMKVEFNEQKSYIKIMTEDIPTDDSIDFNLFLHLPENQKYLLYTQKSKPFNEDQKQRLLNKNITEMYTSVAFEQEYRRFLLRKTFAQLYEKINNQLAFS